MRSIMTCVRGWVLVDKVEGDGGQSVSILAEESGQAVEEHP